MSLTFGAIYAHSSPTKKKFCTSIVSVSPYELCIATVSDTCQSTKIMLSKISQERLLEHPTHTVHAHTFAICGALINKLAAIMAYPRAFAKTALRHAESPKSWRSIKDL
eukprot:1096-Heterococcus_DN1.PRE.2